MFKFGQIGMFQNAKNNPVAIAANEMKNGYVFKIVDGATSQSATPLASAAEAKALDIYVAMNVITTPELLNSADFVIPAGDFVNSFNLNVYKGQTVELSSDLVTTAFADVSALDHLIPIPSGTGQMLWKKADDTGYACTLKVLEKTTFGGTGFLCKISSN